MDLFRKTVKYFDPFWDLKQKRERETLEARRDRKRSQQKKARKHRQTRRRTLDKTLLRLKVQTLYDPFVTRLLKRYNRTHYRGKGQIKKGDCPDIRWKGPTQSAARKADKVWTLCALRDVRDERSSPKSQSSEKVWDPLIVVGIDGDKEQLIVDNVTIPAEKACLQRYLEGRMRSRSIQHPSIVWVNSGPLDVVGGIILFTLALWVFTAIFEIEDSRFAKAVILMGVFYTLSYLFDIGVFIGGFTAGALTMAGIFVTATDMIQSMGFFTGLNLDLTAWIGAFIGAALVILSFRTDLSLSKSDGLSDAVMLRKREWHCPVLYGTRLADGALTAFNIAIGALKGGVMILLIIAQLTLVLLAGAVASFILWWLTQWLMG